MRKSLGVAVAGLDLCRKAALAQVRFDGHRPSLSILLRKDTIIWCAAKGSKANSAVAHPSNEAAVLFA